MRKRTFAAAAVAFILGIVIGAATIASAQSGFPSAPPAIAAPVETSLSLRIIGRNQKRVVGTLMAKVDGKWVEVQLAPQDTLVKAR